MSQGAGENVSLGLLYQKEVQKKKKERERENSVNRGGHQGAAVFFTHQKSLHLFM